MAQIPKLRSTVGFEEVSNTDISRTRPTNETFEPDTMLMLEFYIGYGVKDLVV